MRQKSDPTEISLFMARDLIDTAREYQRDPRVIEFLSDTCFNLWQLQGPGSECVQWDEIFNILDEAYSSEDSQRLAKLDAIYNGIESRIAAWKLESIDSNSQRQAC